MSNNQIDSLLLVLYLYSRENIVRGCSPQLLYKSAGFSPVVGGNITYYLISKGMVEVNKELSDNLILTAQGIDHVMHLRDGKRYKTVKIVHGFYKPPTSLAASGFEFVYKLIDEAGNIANYSITVLASDVLSITWQLPFDTNIVAVAKILLQIGKQLIIEKLKAGTLKEHEEIVMITKDYPSQCPYDSEALPEVSLTEFEVEMPVITTAPTFNDTLHFEASTHDDEPVKVFISYAWEAEAMKLAKKLAKQLREEGIDAKLDQWEVLPGTQIPHFMERMIEECKYVIMLCTPKYKDRSGGRKGGVGYEGHIITAEIFQGALHEKFIPVLLMGTASTAMPSWMKGKAYIDLTDNVNQEAELHRLVAALTGTLERAPNLGRKKN